MEIRQFLCAAVIVAAKTRTPLICILVIAIIGACTYRSAYDFAGGRSEYIRETAVQNAITDDEKEFLIQNSVNEAAVRKDARP